METFRCEKNNGTCTTSPSRICPPGKEPLTADDPQHTDCLGHCCITPDIESSCNPSPSEGDTDPLSTISSYNCIPDEDGDPCPGSWRKVDGNISCQEGRSCCFWNR